ncbi:MAG: primase protein [Parcubacteria group bacterium GW2011_GWA1_47_8]|nr:MAG: primase protein [Parcubacteria group bacterium GW2011_GWA1_47_8]KKW07783.1 MAG: primase protein [Parcubacteria group bacterium GW2011_GWA2_49_16]
MSSVIEEIKSRLNIVDIARSYLTLEPAGGNFKARCPFHNERTPSFFISPARQTYHCFGCNRGGDLISFVEEIEGLDFSGALKILAERAGVELTRGRPEAREDRDKREMLYRTLDLASKFYEAVLLKFPEALEYLKKRGLTDETTKKFRIGFAPDEWRSLGDFLVKKGVSEEAMEKAGLIVPSPKGFYDRFRGRVMFPIADSSGRIIAFSGRILKEREGKTLGASAGAKYVNSPETEVFHKSRALFGFHQAKESMRHENSCVLVEGQMDLILSHQAGVTNTVASSGTALTTDHLSLIKRFTKNLVLAFDADDAGLAAAHRAIGLALAQDMSVRIATLPRGTDPADLVLEDPKEWQSAVREAKPVIDFYLELLPMLYPDTTALRAKVSEIIVPFIALLRSAIDQGHYVGSVAKLLNVKEDPVWEEVKKQVLPRAGEMEKEKNPIPVLPRKARIARTIEGVLLWQEKEQHAKIVDIPTLRTRLRHLFDTSDSLGDRSNLVFEAETRFYESETLAREIEELFLALENEIVRDRFVEKMQELKYAEERGDTAKAQTLLVECQELSQKLHVIKP